MAVNVSPLKLLNRQILMKPLVHSKEKDYFSKKDSKFEKKKDSLIYIINKNKDLSHDFVSQNEL